MAPTRILKELFSIQTRINPGVDGCNPVATGVESRPKPGSICIVAAFLPDCHFYSLVNTSNKLSASPYFCICVLSKNPPSSPPGRHPRFKLCRILFSNASILHLLYFMLKCKAMTEATLSAKNQIVVPREAREALGLKPGDKILVVVRGEKVFVLQRPKSHRVAMRGLARGIYAANHIQKERRDWR